jgi:hypothetical protein
MEYSIPPFSMRFTLVEKRRQNIKSAVYWITNWRQFSGPLLIGLLQRPGAGAGGDLCRPDAGHTGDAGATGADTAPGPLNISQLELSGTFLTFPG